MILALFVFISYSHVDKVAADSLRSNLSAAGCEVQMDTQIKAGDDWTTAVEDMIDRSGAVVVLLSKTRPELNVRAEYLRALRKGLRVIPVLSTSSADIPLPLEPLKRVNISDAVDAICGRTSILKPGSGVTVVGDLHSTDYVPPGECRSCR